MKIGQWPTRTTSAPTAPSVFLQIHNTVHRTGTDLQNEEVNMGIVRSRAPNDTTQAENEAAGIVQPQNASSAHNPGVTEDRGPELTLDYYHFEWFRILIGMILVMVSQIIVSVLTLLGDILVLLQPVLTSIGIGLVSSVLYTGFFVVLMEYHEAVGKAVHKYTRLHPRSQQKCLRFCAYAYPCSVVVGLALVFYLDWEGDLNLSI